MGGLGSIFLLIFSFSLFSLLIKIGYSIWWKPMKIEKCLKEQGIKGAPYKLLYGYKKENLRLMKEAWAKPMSFSHQIVPRVNPSVLETVKNYGEMSLNWVGTTPRVNITDPELIKEIMLNKLGHFQKARITNPLIKLIGFGFSAFEGERWAKHRRIITPAFHPDKLKAEGMLPAFATSCIELIKRWEASVGPQGPCELDVWTELQNLTGDALSRALFGSNYGEGRRIFDIQKQQATLVMDAARGIYIPGFRFLPTKKNIRRKTLDNEIKSLLGGLIRRREEAMKTGECSNNDLLSLLLQYNKDSNYIQEPGKNSDYIGMTMEEMIDECKLFYFAGQETTSVLLTWTMVVLSMHRDWQEKAREEVVKICGKTTTPNLESLNHLKIVTMILHEVIRLYPPVTLLIRQTCKRVKVGEMTLPAGTELSLPIIIIHHDRKLWGEDAEEFKPERFAEGVSKASKHQLAFFPFSWGPRICIGQSFTMMEAKFALAMILQQFSFELSPSYAHAPYTVITLQPQYGAQLILHKL